MNQRGIGFITYNMILDYNQSSLDIRAGADVGGPLIDLYSLYFDSFFLVQQTYEISEFNCLFGRNQCRYFLKKDFEYGENIIL